MLEDDLRIEVYKRGDGKTNAVKITHIPTGKVAICDKYYSVYNNRVAAFEELISLVGEHGSN